ncbi:acyl-CoA dehydratase activase-related protein [Aminobacterium sp. UBA5514]|uniref:acyl-CoA dehydratase activase-related protein n=3 Tax=unclassified Aminobacterium TaxID=2685012 RepID=UPI00257996A2|nr:acyl-CoA dehydratase activase-related protein [Aminobacterium sp. UBA5514]
METVFPMGIDLGSTTVKVVVCHPEGQLLFSAYERHNTDPSGTLLSILHLCAEKLGDMALDVAITGSAGMNMASQFSLPFVQEVVAAARYIRRRMPKVRTMIELGGEDSKMIFFDDNLNPDMNMNGACAGGTGAFIDQIASLLGVGLDSLNTLSSKGKAIYTIASRCGVFAKTDIQSLLAQRAKPEDIVASVFKSIALHVLSSLSRGRAIRGQVLFAGGPFSFFPGLRQSFISYLGLDQNHDIAAYDHPRLLPALGTALFHESNEKNSVSLGKLISRLSEKSGHIHIIRTDLPPLFESKKERFLWEERHRQYALPSVSVQKAEGPLFLGVDSGSTTTKLVLIDKNHKMVLSHYETNKGDVLGITHRAMTSFKKTLMGNHREDLSIVAGASTGYGEDLIRKALDLHHSLVETMAHFIAARTLCPNVSFILDIGGQDMKAMSIKDNHLETIKLNEACSSGCGSFIQTFAESLGLSMESFAQYACEAGHPCDLGTRCTVFMNSSVKQALNEGRDIRDIAAGLAYSVIRNSLHKVLKIRDYSELGPVIVVQGGTFQNPAILRALEVITKRRVVRPVEAGLMGAWGAAIYVAKQWQEEAVEGKHKDIFHILETWEEPSAQNFRCHGCTNSCTVTSLTFSSGQKFYTGNRCRKIFNNGQRVTRGDNFFKTRYDTLFNCPTEPTGSPAGTIGIPRALSMYELYPFWCTFFRECGYKVVLSPPSNENIHERGVSSVMAENICFPAKLAHGHIVALTEMGVDRIFMPIIVHERNEIRTANNSYNCPVVCSYADVIRSALDPEGQYHIPLDSPVFSLRKPVLFNKQVHEYGKFLGINRHRVAVAFKMALHAQQHYEKTVREEAQKALDESRAAKRHILAIACRPYHMDPLINHGIFDLIADLGADAIPADLLTAHFPGHSLSNCKVVTQWAYTNRLYAGAKATAKEGLDLVHISSFGCGVDAVTGDELEAIVREAGCSYSLIKIDEIANLGAARIRLRSILEFNRPSPSQKHEIFFHEEQKISRKKIVMPWFSALYSPLLPSLLQGLGLEAEILSPQTQQSVDIGLEYVHNDMCYPAIVVIGDILKAFMEKQYTAKNAAVLLTQTGGQCRATNYVPLARKALASAGFPDVEVPTFGVENFETAGFYVSKKDAAQGLLYGLLGADLLASLFLSTAPREFSGGSAKTIYLKYLRHLGDFLKNRGTFSELIDLMEEAVATFNGLPMKEEDIPRIGIVGEIFVNYNEFAQDFLVDKLIAHGVEPVLPPLSSFFFMKFRSDVYNWKAYLCEPGLLDVLGNLFMETLTGYFESKLEAVLKNFRFALPRQTLKALSKKVTRVTSLANQAGEGWLLPAEMIDMLEKGINHIVCLQPFGCLANHITGKGVEGVLRRLYPELDLLCLDLDPGTSRTNNDNRLQLLIMAAKDALIHGQEKKRLA